MKDRKRGILLANLGSPDSPTVKDVRKYLNQFLMDKRVIDVPYLLRRFIVSAFVLPKRPKESAHAYQSIWWEEGSPLIVLSERVQKLLQDKIDDPTSLGMRYGNPSLQKAVKELTDQGVTDIFLVPLYPHYAMSSFETVVVEVEKIATWNNKRRKRKGLTPIQLETLPPFYNHPDYIDALVAGAKEYLKTNYDHLLFSYHGLPERHLKKCDPTDNHCLQVDNCCEEDSEAHRVCYRHHAMKTTESFAEKAGLEKGKYSVAFQSRFGKDPWIQPFTADRLEGLPREGVKKLLVICPGFVADCLETLEEIGMAGKESFLEAGGEEFTLIPCLNDHPQWIETLAKLCRQTSGEVKS